MSLEYLLVIASLPVILLCMYIYKHDKDKEPKKLLKKIFLYGIASVIPIIILEEIVAVILPTEDNSNLIKLFIAVFVGVGLIEEGAKWVVTNKCIYNDGEFNHAYDAIVYAVFASLGFALVENILYVLSLGAGTGVLRALITVPSHACDGIFMGYFIGKSKQSSYNGNQKEANIYMLLSLLVPIIAHTLFDYFILSKSNILIVIFFIYTIIMYIICFILVRKVAKIDANFDGMTLDNKLVDIKPESSTISFNYALSGMLILSVILVIIALVILEL